MRLDILAKKENLLSFLFFFILPYAQLSPNMEKNVFEESCRTVSCMFLKGSYWKVEFVRKSFPEQPSVLENVYCLHYSFFKGKGQKILRVYVCSMLLLILMLFFKTVS